MAFCNAGGDCSAGELGCCGDSCCSSALVSRALSEYFQYGNAPRESFVASRGLEAMQVGAERGKRGRRPCVLVAAGAGGRSWAPGTESLSVAKRDQACRTSWVSMEHQLQQLSVVQHVLFHMPSYRFTPRGRSNGFLAQHGPSWPCTLRLLLPPVS